jgi:Xaa-Pro aminopeptidase
VVTDGPELGIYIPAFGVVLIEDNVPVAKDGGEKLTVGSYSTQP